MIKHRMFYFTRPENVDEFKRYVEASGVSIDVGKWGGMGDDVQVVLLEASSAADRLREVLLMREIAFAEYARVEYSEEEIAKAPLTYVEFDVLGRGDERFVVEDFDWSGACPSCGAGRRIARPIRVSSRQVPTTKKVCETLSGLYLFHNDLVARFGEVGVAESELVPVVDRRTSAQLPWWYLQPSSVLPRMPTSTLGLIRDRGCNVCQRDGYFLESMKRRFQPHLSAEWKVYLETNRLRAVPSVFHVSWERYGYSSRLPAGKSFNAPPPFLLCTQDGLQVLREHCQVLATPVMSDA